MLWGVRSFFAAVSVFVIAVSALAAPIGMGFTYQGQLRQSGQTVNGNVNAIFSLYDDPVAGTLLGTQTVNGLGVNNGVFTVLLNDANQFGSNPYVGQALWLAITVNGQPLTPRQALTVAPYTQYAVFAGTANLASVAVTASSATTAYTAPWTGITGMPAGFADGVDDAGPFQLYGTSAYYTGGSVGIGTFNPASTLEVAGGIRARGGAPGPGGNSNNGYAFSNGGDNDSGMFSSADGQLEFYSNAIERFRVSPAGNLGVGTTSPQQRFQVGDNAMVVRDTGSCCSSSNCADSNCVNAVCSMDHNCCSNWDATCQSIAASLCGCSVGVGVGTAMPTRELEVVGPADVEIGLKSSDVGGRLWTLLSSNGSTSGRFEIVDRTGNASRLAILANGNVGIGTTTPGSNLSVAGNVDITGSRFHVDTNGTVGIGTGTPAALLHVAALANEVARIEGSSTTGTWLNLFNSTAARYWRFIVTSTGNGEGSGKLLIGTGLVAGTNSSVMTLDPGGNVGIGTSTPGQKLQVAGNICATGTIGSCSDARFKTNVEPVQKAIDLIEKLRAVRFDWKRGEYPDRQFSGDRQLGLIAQEVQKVAPEVVQKDTDGSLAVDYGRLTPLLVAAVQEQQKGIEARDARIASQQKRLDELAARLARIEARLGGEN